MPACKEASLQETLRLAEHISCQWMGPVAVNLKFAAELLGDATHIVA